jgi:GT2 family glycosyltransferase
MLRGVTYGPFKPNAQGQPWPDELRLRADLAQIHALGFDSIRIYEPPTDALLDGCEEHHLRLLCGIPWTQHVDFIAEHRVAEDARRRIVQEAGRLGRRPCVAAILVGNEIEKTLVRWMGPERVLAFIESLIAAAKEAAPGKLVSYASYPSTEYLIPRNSDFIAFNVFLENRDAFARYVQHLQNLAAGRPLVITEFGLDTRTHGDSAQADAFHWHREVCAGQGVAGSFWFSFTDEWHRGGEEVTGWDFGLVRRDRSEKEAIAQGHFPVPAHASPPIPPSELRLPPSISVLVCTRNGSPTLRPCLEALGAQTHGNYEVVVIDDGSTDDTPAIAKSFPFVRYERQDHAGLSAARNRGMELAKGDLLAYTDDDCIPDEDWLLHVSRAFDDSTCVAAGGPNLPPPPRNGTEACVAVAPGAPSHVLLDDLEAEHLPGCNLVIRKGALRAIGGFREEFTCAGDDVDVCWRLQAHGGRLRFVPAAVVWHHRRRTARAYLRQQRGYGHAEAMLIRRYPHRFAWLGGARWRGMIYGDTPPRLQHTGAVIRFGRFGNALFQTVYAANSPSLWDWMTGLPWLATSVLLFSLSGVWSNGWLAGSSMLLLMIAAAWRRTRILPQDGARVPASHVPLLWAMCLLQPVVRDWGRLSGMVRLNAWPKGRVVWPLPWKMDQPALLFPQPHWWKETFWSEGGIGREALLQSMRHLSPQYDLTWSDGDERSASDATLRLKNGWRRVFVSTVTEFHEQGRSLTRVAFGERHPLWKSRLIYGAGAFLLLAGHLKMASVFWLGVILLALVGWRFRVASKVQSNVQRLVHAAADRCGLWRHEGAEEITPEELHQRLLASAGRSAEL